MSRWRWAALSLACSGYAVLNVAAWYPAGRFAALDLGRAVLWELLRWNLWLPFGALLGRWVRREKRTLTACAGIAVVASFAHAAALFFLYAPALIGVLGRFLQYRWFVLVNDVLTGLIVSGLIIGMARLRIQERRGAELEAQLAQAQIAALKMQLNPHFLFNTLNAIASLQLEDGATARRMMVRVAEFLRMTIDSAAVQQVTLEREVEFLSRYLEIERLRFPRRLQVDFELPPDALRACVPNLILQPVVENAILHGIAKQAAPGRVRISAARHNGNLVVEVRNTGPGMRSPLREGVGLSNTRDRLRSTYGTSASLSIQNLEEGGVKVAISVPFEESR